jgi:hypothetical protein
MLDTHSDARNGSDINVGLSPERRIETVGDESGLLPTPDTSLHRTN